MKKATSTFSLLLGFALAIMAQSNSEWIKYNSPEGRYTVSVPQEPRISTQETATETGEKVPQYMAASVEGNGVFMIGYFNYTPEMRFSFEKARDGMLAATHGTLLAEETISLGSWPGRSLKLVAKYSDDQEFIVRARYYDVGRRVYVLECIFPKAEDSPAIVEKCAKFVDSFQVESPQ